MAGRSLAVPHPALVDEPLLVVAEGMFLRPDQPPLVGAAGRAAAVAHRRPGGPQLGDRPHDGVGDRTVAVPGRAAGRPEVDPDPVWAAEPAAAAAGAVSAPVDRIRPASIGPVAGGRLAGRHLRLLAIEQVWLSAWQPAPDRGRPHP